jgi:xanthosine utilization system XapX-like protein
MFRSVGAALAGMLAAALVVGLVESLSNSIYPAPVGLNPADKAAMEAYMRSLPIGAFIMLLVGWFDGTMAGAFLATLMTGGRERWPSLAVAGAMLAGALFTMMQIPHPPWVAMVGIALFFPAAAAGRWLHRRYVLRGQPAT